MGLHNPSTCEVKSRRSEVQRQTRVIRSQPRLHETLFLKVKKKKRGKENAIQKEEPQCMVL